MEETNKALADLTAAVSAMSSQIGEIHPIILELQGWRPAVERSVEDLRLEVGELRQLLKEVRPETAPVLDPAPAAATELVHPIGLADLPPLLSSTAAPPLKASLIADARLPQPSECLMPRSGDGHGPAGHSRTQDHRGMSPGERTPRAPPVTGMADSHPFLAESSFMGERQFGFGRFPPPPRFDFPLFDGDGPRAWRLKCEAYFRVCTLSPYTWVSCAAMYFIDGALSWSQSTKAHLIYTDWVVFAEAVCVQFGREEFQSLLWQFNRLQQNGSMAEYAEKFTQFMHNLVAHHESWEPSYFITHFVDGLKKDIRAAVVLHRPKTLDTAVDLACLQEEVLEAMRREDKRDDRRYSTPVSSRGVPRTALPLPPPPVITPTKPAVPVEGCSTDRRAQEAAHTPPAEDKIVALRAYRRARGLCFTCGERWGRDHCCGPTVQLHVVEELLAMMHSEPNDSNDLNQDEAASEQGPDCCVLSKEALDGGESSTTMRLHGWVQGREVLMLIDSGSSHSFICESLAAQLHGVVKTHGVTFETTLKVLPLGCYDVILGIDWLAQHSPMKLCATIQGEPNITEVPVPAEIDALINEFEHLFAEPKGLPPQRSFDHTIPLLPGAKPVNVCPYHYSPAQKDEIEKQVADMLAQGIIAPSSSPFASPVLLVQKKDLSWRFCVDYRQLNAITVMNRFPLPVIDELLDELAGSMWFTSLDLRAGYHQIRMKPEDEHKTAFKTHHGHFEFKLLDKHQLRVKKSKCTFARPSLLYLGHEISGDGVRIDNKNIATVEKWPTPSTVKVVRGFLGLAGYYRKFVKNFGIISCPLTDLLKKNTVFRWTSLEEAAFQELKKALITAPVLALPDFQV
ncbi:uncharacterized protein [Aegilops tauschii subsp. strangulata]|uniref:uncharacterized protein n=1 Tax=Aegilops tauschii subsp. strangulata TaxID=200361 RepID=UPI00098A0656